MGYALWLVVELGVVAVSGMDSVALLDAALGLAVPWRVDSATFDPEAGQLDIQVVFERGARFACPDCSAAGCEVHDTVERTWRHMDFFQHKAYLHARVPRVRCAEHGVLQVEVPWARPQSGFTLLFEALVCSLAPHMPALEDREDGACDGHAHLARAAALRQQSSRR